MRSVGQELEPSVVLQNPQNHACRCSRCCVIWAAAKVSRGHLAALLEALFRAAAKCEWDLFFISKSLSLTKFDMDKIELFCRTAIKMTKSRHRGYTHMAAEAILGSLTGPGIFFRPGLFVPGP